MTQGGGVLGEGNKAGDGKLEGLVVEEVILSGGKHILDSGIVLILPIFGSNAFRMLTFLLPFLYLHLGGFLFQIKKNHFFCLRRH